MFIGIVVLIDICVMNKLTRDNDNRNKIGYRRQWHVTQNARNLAQVRSLAKTSNDPTVGNVQGVPVQYFSDFQFHMKWGLIPFSAT